MPHKRILAAMLAAGLLPDAASARALGQLNFAPCELGQQSGGPVYKAECAQLEVAENLLAPRSRKLKLHLALVPARSSKPKPDLVVLLAGGPGQAATEAYAAEAEAFAPLLKDHHVLLLDQRGTGKSNPLKCALPDWKSTQKQTRADLRKQAEECLRGYGGRADPRWYTTSDAVRDLETVRQALGAPQFNLVGGSYGTRVALEYLRRHPAGTRSVILDAVVPPELALLQEHARNLDDALTRIFALCAADKICHGRFGDPAKTLAGLRSQLRERPQRVTVLDSQTQRFIEEPFSEELLSGIVRLYSYQPEAASLLPLLLDEAAKGRPQALVAQGELLFKNLTEQMAHGMELSVVCAEDVPFLHKRPEDAATLLGNDIVDRVQAQCAVWPKGEAPRDFKEPVRSDKPVLILSGELDPVTPPRYGQQVAKTLPNSRHLVLKGQGHTVLMRGCMPKLARKFVDEQKPRELDASCLDALGYLPAFTSYQGPAP